MSKTDAVHEIAVDAGLPHAVRVTYHRAARRWYVEYPVTARHSLIIGHYDSVQDARQRLPAAAGKYKWLLDVLGGAVDQLTGPEAGLLLRASTRFSAPYDAEYQRLIDQELVQTAPQPATDHVLYQMTPTGRYLIEAQIAALTNRAAAASVTLLCDTVTDVDGQTALYTLLERVEAEFPALVEAARDYVTALEKIKKPLASGHYQSRRPEADQTLIYWKQPTHRRLPYFTHEVVCAVCGAAVTIVNNSPTPPAVCESQQCRAERARTLARERKRRQRARGC